MRILAIITVALAALLSAGCGSERAETAVASPPTASIRAASELQPQTHVQSEVVVYTATWCGWCRRTLAWLDEHGVAYDNRDIEVDPRNREELIAKSGGTGIPLVEIGGTLIQGFAPDEMARLLGR